MSAPRSQSPTIPPKGDVQPKLATITDGSMSVSPTNERGSPESVIFYGHGSNDETYGDAMPGPSHAIGKPADPSHKTGRPPTHSPLTEDKLGIHQTGH